MFRIPSPLFGALLAVLPLSSHAQTEAPMTPQEIQVVDLLKAIETGAAEPVGVIDPMHYTQHNLAVKDGLAGFGAVLSQLPAGSARVDTRRVFQDGDLVVAQTDYDFFGPKIGFDIFRFKNGKIVEHWDNLQTTAGPNPSGHTMIDGPTEITDLDKTEANKALVAGFVEAVLVNGHLQEIGQYIEGDHYTQHNPAIADGLSGLAQALEAMATQGITMRYAKVHAVLGRGNFVLTVSEGALADKPTSFYDLFRVEGGKIVEHWDVIETILPEAEWANSNGKFGFK